MHAENTNPKYFLQQAGIAKATPERPKAVPERPKAAPERPKAAPERPKAAPESLQGSWCFYPLKI